MDHQPLNHLASAQAAAHTERFVLTLSCEDAEVAAIVPESRALLT